MHDHGDADRVTVTDDGAGLSRRARLVAGAARARERVAAAGGALDVEPTPGRGTVITAVVAAPAGELNGRRRSRPLDRRRAMIGCCSPTTRR